MTTTDEAQKERESRESESTSSLEFVRKELQKSIKGMIAHRNKLEASLSMHEALSQLNLDEEGFRYKFSIEEHIINLVAAIDAVSEHLDQILAGAFQTRRSRTSKLMEEYMTGTASS